MRHWPHMRHQPHICHGLRGEPPPASAGQEEVRPVPDPDRTGHVPPDTLAVLALDGGLPPEDGELAPIVAHVKSCRRCAATLAALRRTVAAGRSAGPGDAMSPPPARVWQAIARETRTTDRRAVPVGPPRSFTAFPRALRLSVPAVAVLLLLLLGRRRTVRHDRASAYRSAPEEGTRRAIG